LKTKTKRPEKAYGLPEMDDLAPEISVELLS